MADRVCKLALEDGTIFTGTSFGAEGTHVGEVCFNTSMAGYQEILTDPSYTGQIVTMTYPLIGNYGVTEEDVESRGPAVEGFVIKELARRRSNFRATLSLDEYLHKHGRRRHRRRRYSGDHPQAADPGSRSRARSRPRFWTMPPWSRRPRRGPAWSARTWSSGSCRTSRSPGPRATRAGSRWITASPPAATASLALDCGMKLNILRNLVEIGCDVTVCSADVDRQGDPGPQADRHLRQQRARRSRAAVLRDRRPQGSHWPGADLRHLPGSPTAGPGDGRPDLQAQVRPPRRATSRSSTWPLAGSRSPRRNHGFRRWIRPHC